MSEFKKLENQFAGQLQAIVNVCYCMNELGENVEGKDQVALDRSLYERDLEKSIEAGRKIISDVRAILNQQISSLDMFESSFNKLESIFTTTQQSFSEYKIDLTQTSCIQRLGKQVSLGAEEFRALYKTLQSMK